MTLSIAARLFTALIVGFPVVFGQKLSLGVITGVSLTDDYQSGTYTTDVVATPFNPAYIRTDIRTAGSHGFIAGPKVELQLPWRLAFEVDALGRKYRQSFTARFNGPIPFGNGSSTGFGPINTSQVIWDVPVLGKYQFSFRKIRPFVETGVSLRPFSYSDGTARTGFVVGGGAQFSARGLQVEPTLRLTHRSLQYQPIFVIPKQNQLELLVKFHRGVPSAWQRGLEQRLLLGAVGGFSLINDFADKDGSAGSKSKLVGPTFEYQLRKQWSLEIDAIYHPLILSERARATVVTWVLPVLAKRRFTTSDLQPFVELGPSFRLAGNTNGTSPARFGFAGGVGIEKQYRKLRISPVLRYTYWGTDGPAMNNGATTRNQLSLLVGFSY